MARGVRFHRHPAGHRLGFTLVELTIVVLVLAILAVLVMPKFSEAQGEAEVAATAAIMKTFAEAVRRYHTDHGDYPPDVPHGEAPPELLPYLGTVDMNETPIGGQWDYDNWTDRSAAIFKVTIGIRRGQSVRYPDLDALIDDGDLNTGGLRLIDPSHARVQFSISRK